MHCAKHCATSASHESRPTLRRYVLLHVQQQRSTPFDLPRCDYVPESKMKAKLGVEQSHIPQTERRQPEALHLEAHPNRQTGIDTCPFARSGGIRPSDKAPRLHITLTSSSRAGSNVDPSAKAESYCRLRAFNRRSCQVCRQLDVRDVHREDGWDSATHDREPMCLARRIEEQHSWLDLQSHLKTPRAEHWQRREAAPCECNAR